MGMSMSIEAFKPANDTWRQMKAIWDSCETAGIAIPEEVEKYFNHEDPDEAGVGVGSWSRYDMAKDLPCWLKKYSRDDTTGFEVDTSKLPLHVSIVRFTCSW